jgi:hypothetical protein
MMANNRAPAILGLLVLILAAVSGLVACSGSGTGAVSSQDRHDGATVARKWVQAAIARDKQTALQLWDVASIEDQWFAKAWDEATSALAGCKTGNIQGVSFQERTGTNGPVGDAVVTLDPACGHDSSGSPLEQVTLYLEGPSVNWFVQGFYTLKLE